MPAVGRFSGTPASISASDEPHTVAIEEEPFELGDLRHDADRVGEFRRGRQHRANGPPSELAVANLAPAGRAHPASLADGIGRKVVVEQEPLLVGALEQIDILLVLAGAERGDHEGLGFAAGEQRGAVSARQDADLREDRTHRRQVAPINPALMVENVPAHDLGLGVVKRLSDFRGRKLRLDPFRRERSHDLGLRGVDCGVSFLLLGNRIGGAQIGFGDLEHGLLDRRTIAGRQIARLFCGLLRQADDCLDDRLEARMAGHDGLQHRLLGQLLGFRFDHEHRIGRSGDDEVQSEILHFLDRRIEPHFALDDANARCADGPHERHAGEGQRGR